MVYSAMNIYYQPMECRSYHKVSYHLLADQLIPSKLGLSKKSSNKVYQK